MSNLLIVSDSVRRAIAIGDPVVALESTVIAHGLPWPRNMEVALDMEELVRTEGAVPATVAVIDGQLRVGLKESEIERLAKGEEPVLKLSRRDLPGAVAAGATGATTVAATMLLARMAGIGVFATGGIGGVHRGSSGDISADLPELARTAVAVVCSGAKSLLDLPRTLEWLETAGVPVIGYRTDEFPAFYARSSGLPVSERVESPDEAARIIQAGWDLGLTAGVLVAVPIPQEAALEPELVENAISQAHSEAEAKGIRGKALTPFILKRMAEITDGKTLDANLALLRNNAIVAARIARALAKP